MNWKVALKKPNGQPKAWTADGIRITETRNHAGFTIYRVKFLDGTHCHQDTIERAKSYAETYRPRPAATRQWSEWKTIKGNPFDPPAKPDK